VRLKRHWQAWITAVVVVAAVACGTTAAPTGQPGSTTSPTVALPGIANPTPRPTPTTAISTPESVATAMPTQPVSAKDSITLAMNEEPTTMNPFISQGGIAASPSKDNMVDPLTWQSGDDQRIVPTTATESWQQVDADTWRFELRQGVKFHNGEAWNAQAALPSLAYQGVADNDNSSFSYTAGYKAEAVGEYTVNINCDQACPIFPETAFLLNFSAPNYFKNASEEEFGQKTVGFGPYQQVSWEHGISITQEAYDDYVPAGDHFEFQKPYIRNVKWVWRGESTVLAAMVQQGEVDIAFDVGVDVIDSLKPEQIKSGSSAEVFAFWINTLWHPELKKVKVRQAMAHAINCQEIVDSLYRGLPTCRGNLIWPGVVGATERNTAPYEYNPDLSRQLLREAQYDPKNVIKITGRAARIPKQVEVYEAMDSYLDEVGINAEINVVEASVRSDMRECAIGKAVNEVLEAKGLDPETATATLADMQAALDKGGADCPTSDLIESPISSNNLDFGRNATAYLNCLRPVSFVCDPSPGGLQEKLGPALAASGAERQRLLAELADRAHDEVLFLPLFETPVIYALDPKLNFEPRFDRRIRVNSLWFRP
jgi:peptide/nickel transport system substrate-binding protein